MNKDEFLVDLFHQWREHDWTDIDGGDFQELAVKHGLLIEKEATKDDIDEFSDYEIGDPIYIFSDALKAMGV